MQRNKNYTVNNDRVRGVVFISLAIILCFWIFHLLSSRKDDQKSIASNAINVSVSSVALEDVPSVINLVGTVFAYETVALKSRIDSQVTAVHFKDGDIVKEKALLFELDDSLIKAQLSQYEANLKRDEAQLENASSQYERYKKLAEKGFASGEKMEEASANFKTQVAAVSATKASIDNLKAQLKFTRITAPITGRAGTINVTRGNTVKANDTQPLVTINQVKPIKVQFAIPQRHYDALRDASKSNVEVTAQRSNGQNICVGKLEYIDNNIDTATGSFSARAVFENAEENLWPGMFVNVSILLNIDKNALVIPQVSVQSGQGGDFVFVIDEASKKAVKRNIEVFRMQDDKAVIKTGLLAGERIVSDGFLKLTDGASVEIASPVTEMPTEGN